jgi:hypothetical protein
MAAMFSQNPLMNGPNYSFNQTPTTAAGGNKEHSFYPYADLQDSHCSSFSNMPLDILTTAALPLPSLALTSPSLQETHDPHPAITLIPATPPKSSRSAAQLPLKTMPHSFSQSSDSQQMEKPSRSAWMRLSRCTDTSTASR